MGRVDICWHDLQHTDAVLAAQADATMVERGTPRPRRVRPCDISEQTKDRNVDVTRHRWGLDSG